MALDWMRSGQDDKAVYSGDEFPVGRAGNY